MSEPSPIEPLFDAKVSPVACPGCGQRVVLVAFPLEASPACPICRGREASALALEEGAVPAGPWPRVLVRRGPPLAGGALSCSVPGSEALLEGAEGPFARVRREGERLFLTPLGGQEQELTPGARTSIAGRELVRGH